MTAASPATRTRTRTRRSSTPSRTAPRRQGERARPTAAQKAYARRAQRSAAIEHGSAEAALPRLRLRLPRSRASFVLLMMALLATGVVLTLWLSTQAIADSYRLEKLRAETSQLSERAERLQREVAREETISALDRKARGLGMVPSGHPARILITEHGKKRLIGTPEQAAPTQTQPVQPQPPEDGGQDERPASNEQREAE
jgi:hypothetical protein